MRSLVLLMLVPVSLHAQPADPPTNPAPAPVPPRLEPPPLPPTPPPAAPAPGADPEAIAVTYDRGLSFADSGGNYAMRIAFRSQLRFESNRPTEDNSQFASRFTIPRSRLSADGHVFGKANRYRLEIGLGDLGSFSFVKDLFIDKQLAPNVWLRAGQWKRPFNRQELVSDFAAEFNERAITATFVGGGRDLGLAIHNDYERSPEGLEWAAGVFNGFDGGADRPQLATTCTQDAMGTIACTNPTPASFPADFGPAIVVRAGWNSGGIRGYSEGDLEGGPLRFAVGASYKIDLANFAKRAESTVADNMSHGLQVDAMLKIDGFGLLLGSYWMKRKSADAELGVLVQPGYFVVPRRIQVAGRFAYAPPTPTSAREQIELRGALDWYWRGHTWKWSTDVGMVKLTGEDPMTMQTDEPDVQVRSMLQLTI
jgi:hypothetical protein